MLFDRSIIAGAQSKAASQPTDHLPAVNRDQIRSYITSKMDPVSGVKARGKVLSEELQSAWSPRP